MKRTPIRFFLFDVIFVLLASAATTPICARPATGRQETYTKRLLEIVGELDKFIQAQGVKNKLVDESFRSVLKKRQTGDLLFRVDFEKQTGIFSGTLFANPPGDMPAQPSVILVTVPLIDLYPDHQSLVWGLLINTYKLAHDYYHDAAAFRRQDNNALEAYRYRMDAAMVEALFLKEYVKPAGSSSFTKFEETLVSSLENDNLQLVSLLFEITEMRVAYRLSDIFNRYWETHDRPAARRELVDLARQVLDIRQKMDTTDEWQKYCAHVLLWTYKEYGALVFASIESEGKGMMWSEALKRDKDFARLFSHIEEQALRQEQFLSDYHDKTIAEFEIVPVK